ncbi:(Fe-S)-binding protein [Bacillus salipaludis]|uniref:(Fe-S)-binding protein n=1 Tax=Bacillus salipaludis TaxID=2547811 RepID=A0A4R5W025_9BACI|nr:(Fe-S)-binding protein [Bacillus salipaludis]MDQ6594910.1 (Fe-S)-binding protein [Bacillus salipaludis]TDK64208.1 (Fe-S)-binding protein [Bacillus salipaludis]
MEVLFWVGCATAYDVRLQSIARAFVDILKKADVDFATLGAEERCTGDMARRAGDEALFQELAFTNIKTLKKHKVDSIVTTCPHCFNMFKNEYPQLGGDYKVMHYTTFIYQLIEQGRIKIPDKQNRELITYHDPCYLGRQNGVFDEPRDILEMLGYELKEMDKNKKQSMCCGAGGAAMFQSPSCGKKINTIRAEEAVQTGGSMTVTSCPFCFSMMEEALGLLQQDGKTNMVSKDIAEIVNELVTKGD